ncbi:hypothetical protein DDT91_04700 [Algoriphagus sp. AK58]|nr:hypothetical protein [Algoriphagus sp. AK58]
MYPSKTVGRNADGFFYPIQTSHYSPNHKTQKTSELNGQKPHSNSKIETQAFDLPPALAGGKGSSTMVSRL